MITADMTAIARPYARALLAGVPMADRPLALSALEGAVAALADPAIGRLVARPGLDRAALVAALAPPELAPPAVGRLIGLLVENGRLAALPGVARAFAALKDAAENRSRATVTSAHPLSAPERERLRQALARRTGQDIELAVETDPALLAGVIVQHGDMVFDGSVRGRLAALAHALSPF